MGGTATSELRDLYRRAGLHSTDVPADYLGAMLECAAYLRENDMDDLLAELTDKHLEQWLGKFAHDLEKSARLSLYHELGAQLGRLFARQD
jgi:TorA maturation chaperone TorD